MGTFVGIYFEDVCCIHTESENCMYVSALFVNSEWTMGPADTDSHFWAVARRNRVDEMTSCCPFEYTLPSSHSFLDRHPSRVIIVHYGWLTYRLAFASDYIPPLLLQPLYFNTPLRIK